MRYRTLNSPAEFSADTAAFVNLMGELEYRDALLKLGSGLRHKGYVTEIDDLRYSLELELLNLELLRLEMGGALPGMPEPLHEAADFVLGVGQTIPHLSEGARAKLRGRLLSGLRTNGLRPLQHEFRIAGAASHHGYDVTFADLEGGQGSFDFLARRGGTEFEIEGKCVPAFLGQPILPQDAEKLFLAIARSFNVWTDSSTIPVLTITLKGRLDVGQSAITALVDACNATARTGALAALGEYATVDFVGAFPSASPERLWHATQIDRAATWADVFFSPAKRPVVVRLQSTRPSKFARNLLSTLSDAAKRQLSGNRPAVIWLHVDYLNPATFHSLAHAEKGPSFFDLVALAVLDSPKRTHLSQLVFSGGAHLGHRDGYAVSRYMTVVYNAPHCRFGDTRPFHGGRNLRLPSTLTDADAKRVSAANFKFLISSGPKEINVAATGAIFRRLSESHQPHERLVAARAIFAEALSLGENGRSKEALLVYDGWLTFFAETELPDFQELIAAALFNRGNMLGRLGRHEEALDSYATVARRFGASEAPLIAEKVARALYNSAKLLERDATRVDEAIAAYTRIVGKFRASPNVYPEAIVAQSFVNMGNLLGLSKEALPIYDEVIHYFHASLDSELREQVKKALVNKGRVLISMDRVPEALGALDSVLAYPDALQSRAGLWATFWKIRVLQVLGREDGIAQLCDKLVEAIDPTVELKLREACATALMIKASLLRARRDRVGEAATYGVVLTHFGLDYDRELVAVVIDAQERCAEALQSLGRYAEASLAYDDIVARCERQDPPQRPSEHVAWALSAKASLLGQQERSEEAAKVCSEIIARFGPSSSTPLLEFAAGALVDRAGHFCDLGHFEEAMSDCKTFLTAYESSCEPWAPARMALALLTEGLSLLKLEKVTEAREVLTKVVTRFVTETGAPVTDYIDSARALLEETESG